jgi:hypothetical protein
MAEVLARFSDHVADDEGRAYRAQACGAPNADGLWDGWIEFMPLDGGPAVRSPRETTQPNGRDAAYWASGLTAIYLEGALARALNPPVRRSPAQAEPLFDGPAADRVSPAARSMPTGDAVLNPFSVFEKGEVLLRKELGALSPWPVNIIRATGSARTVRRPEPDVGAALVDIIVDRSARYRPPDERLQDFRSEDLSFL